MRPPNTLPAEVQGEKVGFKAGRGRGAVLALSPSCWSPGAGPFPPLSLGLPTEMCRQQHHRGLAQGFCKMFGARGPAWQLQHQRCRKTYTHLTPGTPLPCSSPSLPKHPGVGDRRPRGQDTLCCQQAQLSRGQTKHPPRCPPPGRGPPSSGEVPLSSLTLPAPSAQLGEGPTAQSP